MSVQCGPPVHCVQKSIARCAVYVQWSVYVQCAVLYNLHSAHQPVQPVPSVASARNETITDTVSCLSWPHTSSSSLPAPAPETWTGKKNNTSKRDLAPWSYI